MNNDTDNPHVGFSRNYLKRKKKIKKQKIKINWFANIPTYYLNPLLFSATLDMIFIMKTLEENDIIDEAKSLKTE